MKLVRTPLFRCKMKFTLGFLFFLTTIFLMLKIKQYSDKNNIMLWIENFENAHKNDFVSNSLETMREAIVCEELYLGCFPTVGSNEAALSSTQMTKTECFEICSKRKEFYAGLKNGSACICASSLKRRGYTNQLSEAECGLPCLDDNGKACGGAKTIDWYRLKNPCMKTKNSPEFFENSRLIGCCLEYVKGEKKTLLNNFTTISCILNCGQKRFPLAMFDGHNSTCICERSLKRKKWTHNFDLCENKSLKIYRTLSHDENCEPLHFLPLNSSVKRSALVSYPGSGNTWTRHMIEQATGIYTGSVYGDRRLFDSGFLGEMPSDENRTFVIKTHLFHNNLRRFDTVIFLIRNPYDAYIADFNRLYSSGKNHTGYASIEKFNQNFNSYLDHYAGGKMVWESLFQSVLKSEKPFHLLFYEDLLQDPVNELGKVLKFLEKNNNFMLPNLEARLLCLSENLQGTQKRRKDKNQFDPYDEKLVLRINSKINHAQNLLTQFGLNVNISAYKRNWTMIF